MRSYFEFTKAADDGFKGEFSGYMTTASKDKDSEALDYKTSKRFFQQHEANIVRATGGRSHFNVRAQHSSEPVGVIDEMKYDDANQRIWCKGHVVGKENVERLRSGLWGGLSIGGKYLDKTELQGGTTAYTASPCEISLVDAPSNPDCFLQAIKSARPKPVKFQSSDSRRIVAKLLMRQVAQEINKANTAHNTSRPSMSQALAYESAEDRRHGADPAPEPYADSVGRLPEGGSMPSYPLPGQGVSASRTSTYRKSRVNPNVLAANGGYPGMATQGRS
jgi:hypothetical protein